METKDVVELMLNKQDRMNDDIGEIKVSLKYHIKRTNLLEESIELLRKDVKPIERYVTIINGILKLIGLSSIIIGAIASFIKVIEFIK